MVSGVGYRWDGKGYCHHDGDSNIWGNDGKGTVRFTCSVGWYGFVHHKCGCPQQISTFLQNVSLNTAVLFNGEAVISHLFIGSAASTTRATIYHIRWFGVCVGLALFVLHLNLQIRSKRLHGTHSQHQVRFELVFKRRQELQTCFASYQSSLDFPQQRSSQKMITKVKKQKTGTDCGSTTPASWRSERILTQPRVHHQTRAAPESYMPVRVTLLARYPAAMPHNPSPLPSSMTSRSRITSGV